MIFKWGRKPTIFSAVVLILIIVFTYYYLKTPDKPISTHAGIKVKEVKEANSQPTFDTKASVALKEYLYVKYGGNGNSGFGVSWYNAVTNITVTAEDPRTVKVTTTLSNNDQGKSDATEIARAIMANTLINIGTVTVSDGSGAVLASKEIAN